MRIAVHTPFGLSEPIAETELFERLKIAATRLGWSCLRTDRSRDIEKFAPDVVLVEQFTVAKLTPYPTLGLMWAPPAYWETSEQWLKNVASYDGHLFADPATARFVDDVVSPVPVRFVRGRWFPTCQATELKSGPRAGLSYLGTGWDKDRHRELLDRLAGKVALDRFGPAADRTSKRTLPFDGVSVIETLTRAAAALCWHSPQHRKWGIPTARAFEAAASGAIIISDEIGFVRETFGSAALYVNIEAPPDEVADQVAQHMTWIEGNPEAVERKRVAAHRIFIENYAFDVLLRQLPRLISDIKRAWQPAAISAGRSVGFVVRTGGRDLAFLDRAIKSLEDQTHRNVHTIVVAYRDGAAIRKHLSSRPAKLAALRVIDSADNGFRSSALWAGLKEIDTDFFGILDDDDSLMPNHVAACLATLERYPESDLAYAGTLWVSEGENSLEHRTIAAFRHFDPTLFRKRNSISSNAWLARRSTLLRLGMDPELGVGEDYYLLLRLLHDRCFTPTWRLTAEYQKRPNDQTHSPLSTEQAGSFVRIKRRFLLAPDAYDAPLAEASLDLLANNDLIAARILGRMIKRQYLRKGLQVYLTDFRGLPKRFTRLPSIIRHGGIKKVRRIIEQRGAREYARRKPGMPSNSDQ